MCSGTCSGASGGAGCSGGPASGGCAAEDGVGGAAASFVADGGQAAVVDEAFEYADGGAAACEILRDVAEALGANGGAHGLHRGF